MSKKSCEAAESIEDALLRMARVNSNIFYPGHNVRGDLFYLRFSTSFISVSRTLAGFALPFISFMI